MDAANTITEKKSYFTEELKANLRKATLKIRAIDHPLRRRIIEMLLEFGQMTVTDTFIRLRLEQSVASQHLAILRRAGVVITERQGKFIYYSINVENLEAIKLNISRFLGND